ncbi:MAG: DUF2007 domain-containing protein [Lentimicrobiaceae bacterium]|nr:DUF2007 domain-containing protein [Lentimicrobiaceae bacterium]
MTDVNDWKMIYCTNQIVEVEIIKNILDENGIICVDINKMDSAYLFGEIELYVQPEFEEKAKSLIPDFSE